MSDASTETVQSMPILYETDFAVWLDQTSQLLREKRFTEIDVDNLIEEIDSLSRRDKRELRSRLIVLLSHLLKYRYQPENHSQSWLNTIVEQRRQIELILEDSPSLKSYLTEVFAACYAKARIEAQQETQLEVTAFPESCPFTQDDVLASN